MSDNSPDNTEADAKTEIEATEDAHPKGRPRTVKEAKKDGYLLQKGVRKFLRYNRDLISVERLEKIASLRKDFDESMADDKVDLTTLDHRARDLTRACEVSVPDYKPSILRENIEVIFVAFVIAMGIRAYFLQPFKIPTGSMQPTLNGVRGYPPTDGQGNEVFDDPNYEPPSALRKVWEKIWNGRSYVNIVAEDNGRLLLRRGTQGYYGNMVGRPFKKVRFEAEDGTSYSIPSSEMRPSNEILNPAVIASGGVYRKGQVIARGYVQTGDQVLVDKFTYHWARPDRSDVFVFTTKNLPISTDPNYGSQHYIKRLAGVPGDRLKIEPPRLFVNGEVAEEFGFRRVMSQEGEYPGYRYGGTYPRDVPLGPTQYFALGDNSASSKDSRDWGYVPRENIVGRAVMVYWPFGQHFGRIR
jgi:signal peptidase I